MFETDASSRPLVLVPELCDVPKRNVQARPIGLRGFAFGSAWRVDLYVDPAAFDAAGTLAQELNDILETIDAQLSPYRPLSDLVRLNVAPPGQSVHLPELSMTLLRHAFDMAELTDGAFDPSVLDAVELWGFGTRKVEPGLPETSASPTVRKGRWRNLELSQSQVHKRGEVRFDLCAIAKGFATDQLLLAIKATEGVTAALINIGGELKSFGIKPDGQPWWVEVEDANVRLALVDMAVATSGSRVRHFVHDGRQYSHTIDGATGEPTQSRIASATVIDSQGWRADALATALIVMGEERAIAFAVANAIACLLLIESDGLLRRVLSPALVTWQ